MESKLNKTELNAELHRLKSRGKFLRAAYYGAALPKDVLTELLALEKSIEFVLRELKK
jgi:hypothetical protein